MSKIVDLESTVKRNEHALQLERYATRALLLVGVFLTIRSLQHREQLLKAKNSLEAAASHFKCQICISEDITHVLVPCGHTFCGTCVEQLQRNKCPMCRTNIEKKVKFFVAEG